MQSATNIDLRRICCGVVTPHHEAVPEPGLRLLASICDTGSCPTIYRSDHGTLVVQGYAVSADRAGVSLPDGELLVEIPADLLTAAVRAMS